MRTRIKASERTLTDKSLDAVIDELRRSSHRPRDRMLQVEYAIQKILIDSLMPSEGMCDCSLADMLNVSRSVTASLNERYVR
jgi:hypothetical protein